jgi:hypothetical protein
VSWLPVREKRYKKKEEKGEEEIEERRAGKIKIKESRKVRRKEMRRGGKIDKSTIKDRLTYTAVKRAYTATTRPQTLQRERG